MYHGDIKTENILVTSWNWLYLTDFSSSYKKTYLPEDNPADFSYFFDISGRRTCYLAPERFLGVGEEDDGRGVTWAMDVFSVGCVIAELFVESPIFSLSQLFKYRKGEYDPEIGHLNKIEDGDVRELVSHMIQVEPEARYSAEEYLNFWRRKAFPEYFYSFLHQYMGLITDPASGRAPVLPETTNFGEADERIDRVYLDFDKISYFLGYDSYEDPERLKDRDQSSKDEMFPVQIDIPDNRHTASSRRRRPADDGTLIFLTLVVSSLRNTARATARLRACDLLLAFAERITDEAKLDRILPYLVVLLNDKVDSVKIAALRSVTQLLATVEVVSPVNAYVFTEYIRPRLQGMIYSSSTKSKPAVRATYASCLASLAHSSLKILDMIQALREEGSIPKVDPDAENTANTGAAPQDLYDIARADLVEHFETHTKALLTDPDAMVRRAFLGSVSSLCVFFGAPKANDVVLSHLNTYLNDKDWQLKCAFFQIIVGVATFVGSSSLEDFILPLMLQALTDPEEFVVERVIRSFASMAELGLFQRSRSWEMIDILGRFMMHPNIWIREAAVHFICATTQFLSLADNYCIILPLIRPYLNIAITDFTETEILDALKRPISRAVLDMAMTWSQKVDRGLFWKHFQEQRTFSFGGADQTLPIISSKDLTPALFRKIPKNDEDEQWLAKLRNLGLAQEDEFKFLALRDYIFRMASRKNRETSDDTTAQLTNVINLQDLNITPQTIFFENNPKLASQKTAIEEDSVVDGRRQKQHTIADALLDASTTITDPPTRNGKEQANGRKGKDGNSKKNLVVPGRTKDARRGSHDIPSSQASLSSSPSTRAGSIDTNILSGSTATITVSRPKVHEDKKSDGTLTPTDSIRSGPHIRHRNSAINLLKRGDTQKSLAETGTSSTNATGEMDGLVTQDAIEELPSMLHSAKRSASAVQSRRMNHTYDGSDPNVLKLLDTMASENYPVDELDFGPIVTPVNRRSIRNPDSQEPERPWRPRGIHVATFGEHTDAINRILPSPDHVFFLTASDDGTVKVWDTLRLERNLIHRSRQTYKHAEGAQVKCITFVENTHTFISCATDGSVNVVKVDCSYIGDTTKYGKLRLKRDYSLPTGEYAVWCEHFRTESKSTLLLATNSSRVLALDLRTMSTIYSLSSPLHYGTPTTFCTDRKHNWLLLGTAYGVLSFYDLRFRLHIKAWTLPARAFIHRLSVHHFKGRGRWICMAGGTGHPDVTVWDLDKMECREVFRAPGDPAHPISNTTLSAAVAKDLTKPLQAIPIALTSSLSSSSPFTSLPTPSPTPNGTGLPSNPPSIRSFALSNPLNPHSSTTTSGSTSDREALLRHSFLLTTGPDRKVRFWDTSRPEASAVVSGLGPSEDQPRFLGLQISAGLAFNVERTSSGGGGGKDKESHKDRDREREKGKDKRESRVTTIAREQRALLRGHLDVVTDVTVLEAEGVGMTVGTSESGGAGPGIGAGMADGRGAMVVSADRRGVICVFL